MTVEHFDVLVVGAGLSGIAAGYHLQDRCPNKTYAILEARDAIGGTWDLFRYPGVRSDSDMYTLGYAFKPWTDPKAIADGPSIRSYVRETAAEHGIDQKIRFHHAVTGASWSSEEARWTVHVQRADTGGSVQLTCGFLLMCSGYYDYDEGYTPDFEGIGDFNGTVIHPQHWPEDLDYSGKRVVVIGSGATAVTLVPEMADAAAHVTMLQRSPTYIVARPSDGAFNNRLRQFLPDKVAYGMTRWLAVLLGMYFYRFCRSQPERARQFVLKGVREQLGPDFDIEKHFTPTYNPWEQRLCLAPDGDFFEALKGGKASVVTDHIERFTPSGLKLRSGEDLEADIIVTATGLKLQMLGGMALTVDGVDIDPAETMGYKGLMFSGIPNMATCFGYTNASWTLKCDLTCEYICRLINYMDRKGFSSVTPRLDDPEIVEEPWVDFSSGYIQRAQHILPKQGNKAPWKLHQNYALDIMTLRHGRIEDGSLVFARAGQSAKDREAA